MPCKLLFLLLMELSLATGGYAQQGQVGIADRPATTRNNLKVFDSLCNNISERYFDPKFNGADWDKLEQKYRPLAAVADSTESLITVLRQMVAELKTTHLEVSLRIDPKVVQQKIGQRIAIKRDLIWLNAGFQLKSVSQSFLVTSVNPSTPAASIGVQPGWIVVAVNGRPISRDWTSYVGFREGQQINYTFVDSQKVVHTLDIESAFYTTPIVRESRLARDNVAYIRFDTFDRGTGAWVMSQVDKYRMVPSIIIDLRENTGGLVTETKSVLSKFFREPTEYGTFVERHGRFKEQKIIPAISKAFPGKVFVLVDSETASAAEIFARIMQENRRGIVIGGRTRGAVLNSLDVELSDKIELRFPFRDYFSPKGIRLEGVGVLPDMLVEYTIADFRNADDPILKAALRMAEKDQN